MTLLAQKGIDNPVITNLVGKTEADAPGILGKLFSGIIAFLLVIGTIWAFFQLLLGGINWISSSGDKGKLEAAQQKIIQAIIGLGIIFASWAVFIAVLSFLGVTGPGGEFKLKLPTLF